jgi:hypothetical protein
MTAVIDLSGQRFGRLAVLGRAQRAKPEAYWHCRCDCGVEVVVNGCRLRNGNTRSCGCLRRETAAINGDHNVSHGYARMGIRRHPLYSVWSGMRTRCRNPNNKNWKDYGGRGITVCERWDKFENFLADMGERPGPSYSIDRIDVEGNYEPGNCRWATPTEQVRNRRVLGRAA